MTAMTTGASNSIADVPGIRVGNATDPHLKSGVTVVTARAPFTASVAVMGGAPGTRETDLLAPDKSVAQVDALVLSGGSAFGLDACSGVADGLRAAGRGFAVGTARVPIVPGAILFDLLAGGAQDWKDNPYRALGRRAFAAAGQPLQLGSFGAGTGATTAVMKGGLGTASMRIGAHVVGALVAANPVGSVTTPGERHFWAAPFEQDGEFGGLGPDPRAGLGGDLPAKLGPLGAAGANTTIGIVVTSAPLSKAQCQRLAWAAQDGIARAIVPAHSPLDGDLIFAASMTDGDGTVRPEILAELGHAAAVCVARAIARGVYHAEAAPNDTVPTWRALNGP